MENVKIQKTSKYRKKPIPRGRGEVEKLQIESRRQKVFELTIKGLTKARIAEVLKVSIETIWDDLKAVRQKQTESMKKKIQSFDIEQFWEQRLEELGMRKSEMYVALAEGKSDRAAINAQLREIDKEIERALTSAGVKLSKENPEDIAHETLKIIWPNRPDPGA